MDTYTHFYCTCQDDSRQEADEMLAEVMRDLDCDPTNLLSRVVYGLEWNLPKSAYITMMACDQWARVTAETYEKDAEGEPLFSTSIDCDDLEHGLAGTWKAFADKFIPR